MNDNAKKLFILDAFALIYRSYYAFIKNPRINSTGENTSAVFGFTTTLWEVLQKQKPSHIIVAFDTPGMTKREEAFAAYKATREDTPEDILKAIPHIKNILHAFKIQMLELEGYEADDIIGAIAKQAEEKGFTTYMMSMDKDLGQLITEKTFLFKPPKGGRQPEIIGLHEICAKYQILHPKQIIDILGLMGDQSDNIPGIPGVGEKTAVKLISKYGSIENTLQHIDEIKGKLKEHIESNKEQALLSKQLATIMTNLPVRFEPEACAIAEPDADKLKSIFHELEFLQLAKRILQADLPAKRKKPVITQGDLFAQNEMTADYVLDNDRLSDIVSTPHHYCSVNDAAERKTLIRDLLRQKCFCFDTETTSVNPNLAELIGLAFSWKKGEAFYVPFPDDKEKTKTILQEFLPVFHSNALKTGQNLKYDLIVLRKYGIDVTEPFFDTMVAHYLIHPDMRRRNLNQLSEQYLAYAPVKIETLIGTKGQVQSNMRDVPVEKIVEYAGEDADITLQLKEVFSAMLEETGNKPLFDEVEAPLVPVLAAMESEGINISTDTLAQLSEALEKDANKVKDKIYQSAGREFNISSPKQVGEILFEQLKIDERPKKTRTGQYATGEDVLMKLKHKHQIVEYILEYRELLKLKNTYVDPLPLMINPYTKRIHTSFNQVVTSTGRLSSDNPNLQNIPIRTIRGKAIRKAFIPRNRDYTLMSADYSQIELRIIASMSKDESMINAFARGLDIHSATASKLFSVPIKQVSKNMRSKAKAVNFGIAYGQTAFGLSQNLNIPRKEASEIIDHFFKQFPGVKILMDHLIETARKKGYVETMKGRRRYLPDINSNNANVRSHAERNAINSPIQGTAADMIKLAMIHIHRELVKRKLKSKMLLQVHDELVFDVYLNEKDEVINLVEDKMKSAISLCVPVIVDIKTGDNWLEAH